MALTEINPATFEEMKNLLGDEFDAFIQVFVQDTQNNITGIAEAERIGDMEVRTRLAHTVKSSLATIGAENLSQVAFAIERADGNVVITEDLATLQTTFVEMAKTLSG